MNTFAIRLLTLALFAVSSAAIPMIVPSKAAAATHKTKKHKAAKSSGGMTQSGSSGSTGQSPPNMADDPSRKVGY